MRKKENKIPDRRIALPLPRLDFNLLFILGNINFNHPYMYNQHPIKITACI